MYKHFFKRLFDFCIALVALLILFVPLLIVTIWLYFANKGNTNVNDNLNWWQRWLQPVIFTQERPGKNEKIFNVIKFRSMTDERDSEGNLLPDKDRITSIGKFIRKTSIDELPQLINVLKGDMALIGPRPLLPEYLPWYTADERRRHEVRPGISGLAQTHGRNNLTWEETFKDDVFYVDHLSFWLDVKIVLSTIKNVLSHKDIVVVPTGGTIGRLDLAREAEKKNSIDL